MNETKDENPKEESKEEVNPRTKTLEQLVNRVRSSKSVEAVVYAKEETNILYENFVQPVISGMIEKLLSKEGGSLADFKEEDFIKEVEAAFTIGKIVWHARYQHTWDGFEAKEKKFIAVRERSGIKIHPEVNRNVIDKIMGIKK